MEKVINAMPNNGQKVKAELVLEINNAHPIAQKLKELYKTDSDLLKKYTKMLFDASCLIGGRNIDDPLEYSNLVCELMTK